MPKRIDELTDEQAHGGGLVLLPTMAPSGKTAVFVDAAGDERVLVKRKGPRTHWQVQNKRTTPALALNRAVAKLIGLRIRQLRLDQGLTLASLCERAGLVSANPKARMREIEVGERREGMRLGTLYALAAALGVSPGSLLPKTEAVLAEAGVTMETQTTTALRVSD